MNLQLENGLKNQTSNEELDALRKLIEQLQKDLVRYMIRNLNSLSFVLFVD